MKNKKLIVGLCTGAAALGAAAAATGVVLSLNNTNPQKGDYKLTFDAGNGRFKNQKLASQMVFHNQQLDRTPQPEVVSNKSGEMFAGWQDETGRLVTGQQTFNKDTKLTATYNSGTTGDYCTITFLPGDATGVVLQGNTSISVKKGYMFFMINRPSATATQKYFKNWVYAENVYDSTGEVIIHKIGDTVGEKDTFEKSVKLKPDWTQAVTITWDPGEGGTRKRGQDTTTLSYGTAFDQFNQPHVSSISGMFFSGWYKTDGVTKMQPTDLITSNMTVVAHWQGSPTPEAGYATLYFVSNETEGQPSVEFAPSTFQVVKGNTGTAGSGATWKETVRPTITTSDGNWEIDEDAEGYSKGWQMSDDGGAWGLVDDDFEFVSGHTYKFRPYMKSSIKSVSIVGETTLLPEDSSIKYLAPVTGGKSQDVTWQLYANEECTTELSSDVATITKGADGAGYVTVKSLTESDTSKFWIKATSTVNTAVSNKLAINIEMPYNSTRNSYNKLVWFRKDFGAEGVKWASLSPTELCINLKEKEVYTYTYLYDRSKTEELYLREDFTSELYLGRGISIVPEQFMINWTGFNGDISLGDQVTEIQGSFMENCTNFNKTLSIPNVTSIGNHFLYGDTAYNNGGTALTLGDNLTNIGDDFLGKCTSFNQTLTLPTTNKLKIGGSFLYGCTSFNKDLTIPSNVTSIGSFFMTQCGDYTSKLTVNVVPTTVFSGSPHDISVESSTPSSGTEMYPLVKTGFTVAGTYATAFKTLYPKTANGNIFVYRTYASSFDGKVTKAEYSAAVKEFLAIDQPFNGQYTSSQTDSEGTDTFFDKIYQDTTGGTVYIEETADSNVYYYQQLSNLQNYFVQSNSDGTFNSFSDCDAYENILSYRKLFQGEESELDNFTWVSDVLDEHYQYWKYNSQVYGADLYIKFDETKTLSRIEIVYGSGEDKVVIATSYVSGGGKHTPVSGAAAILAQDTTKKQNFSVGSQSWLANTTYGAGFSLSGFTEAELETAKYNNIQFSMSGLESITASSEMPKISEIYIYNKSTDGKFSYAGTTTAKSSYDETGSATWYISPVEWNSSYTRFLNSMIVVFEINSPLKQSDVTISAELSKNAVNFSSTSWEDIATYVNEFETSSKTTTDEQTLCSHFSDITYKEGGATLTERLQEFLWKEHALFITDTDASEQVEHSVRVIGLNHDTYGTASNTALLTFELNQRVTDSNGDPLVSSFGSDAKDYANSNLRKNLVNAGTGTGTLNIYDRLPTELKVDGVLKAAKKYYQKYDSSAWSTSSSVEDKIFPLNHTEYYFNKSGMPTVGSVYDIYSGCEPGVRAKWAAQGELQTDEAYWALSCDPTDATQSKVYVITCETGAYSAVSATEEHSIAFAFCI